MFKSVFSRMLAAFTVILLLCITLLVFVVASGLFQESQEKELSELGVAANEIGFFLEEMQRISALPAPLILQSESFHSNLIGIADLTEADISVLRMDGVVATTSSNRWKTGEQMLSKDTVDRIMENDTPYMISNLEGALERRQLNSFAIIGDSDGNPVYLIVVTSEKALESDIANSVTQRMVVVAIWIFFAAMIIIFLISRRITDSIKTLCSVAREYAQGRFNIRIKGKFNYSLTDTFMGFHCGNTPSCKMCDDRAVKYQLIQHRLLEPVDSEPDFTRGTLEGDIAASEITFYRLQCDSEGVLRAYIAEGEVLPVATRSFGGIGIFAINEMGRFYRHVLVQKRYPHHGAVAFAHCGEALYEVLKYFGVCDIAYNQPKGVLYKTENPFA